jgi:hypothetical protein
MQHCPFCGETDVDEQHDETADGHDVWLWCLSCCAGSALVKGLPSRELALTEAQRTWNQRVDTATGCPFCGGAETGHNVGCPDDGEGGVMSDYYCVQCGASGPAGTGPTVEASAQAAARLWNTRAVPGVAVFRPRT